MSLAARLLALFSSRPRDPGRDAASLSELALLIALAEADGVMSEREKQSLAASAAALAGGPDIEAAVEKAHASSVDDLAAEVRAGVSRAGREELMRAAVALAAADGETSEMESANLERFARLLGVPQALGEDGAA
jgi:uncharacterized tellurite resistance protein B-like protein